MNSTLPTGADTADAVTAVKLNAANSELDQPACECRTLDPLSDPRWDQLVASHSDCHIFHCSAWAKVLGKTYNHKPLYFHLSQGTKTLAVVPLMEIASAFTGRRGVCLPFSDFCNPLLFDQNAQSFVVRELTRLARTRNWRFFELRGGAKPSASAVPSAAFYSHTIDLSLGTEQLFARFAGSVRRAIRKASKSGVIAEISCTRESLLAFYKLHVRTRRRHGIPPQPFKFFLRIQEELMSNGMGFIVLAHRAARPMAGAMFFRLNAKAFYKYAASDERCQQFRGNDAVMWEGIRFLEEGGARTLDLGRTSLEDDGLRRFKLGWAVTEKMLHYFRFDVAANSWLSIRGLPDNLHKKVFSRLPLKLNQLAGAMIYPHLD